MSDPIWAKTVYNDYQQSPIDVVSMQKSNIQLFEWLKTLICEYAYEHILHNIMFCGLSFEIQPSCHSDWCKNMHVCENGVALGLRLISFHQNIRFNEYMKRMSIT